MSLDSTLLDQLALTFARAAANQFLKCESESRNCPAKESEPNANQNGDFIERKRGNPSPGVTRNSVADSLLRR